MNEDKFLDHILELRSCHLGFGTPETGPGRGHPGFPLGALPGTQLVQKGPSSRLGPYSSWHPHCSVTPTSTTSNRPPPPFQHPSAITPSPRAHTRACGPSRERLRKEAGPPDWQVTLVTSEETYEGVLGGREVSGPPHLPPES